MFALARFPPSWSLYARGVHAVTPAALLAPSAPILEKLSSPIGTPPDPAHPRFLPPDSATDYALDDVLQLQRARSRQGWIEARRAMGQLGETATTSEWHRARS